MKKVLVMGLPGAGKTTLSDELEGELKLAGYSVYRLSADIIRSAYNDWDFSEDGRIRQALRMKSLASVRTEDFVVVDFVAALESQRIVFDPDYLIWMNTIKVGRFQDTNEVFQNPKSFFYEVTEKNSVFHSAVLTTLLAEEFNIENDKQIR